MTDHRPILCVVATKHWPLAGYDALHAKPAIGSAVVVAQFLVTQRQEKDLRGLCQAVYANTPENLAAIQRKYPHVPYDKLGFFLWHEPEAMERA